MTKQTLIKPLAATVNTTKAKVAGGAALLMGSAAVHAQEASSASTAFSDLQSQITEYSGNAWSVMIAVTATLLGMKLFRKMANRAT